MKEIDLNMLAELYEARAERDRLVGEREDSRLLRDLAHEEADFLRAENERLDSAWTALVAECDALLP